MDRFSRTERTFTRGDFDRLLDRLDADRERAARKYEHIRLVLIEMFTHKGCAAAEELADLTIDRVISRLPEISDSYVGDLAPYFLAVANNIYREYWRQEHRVPTFSVDFYSEEGESLFRDQKRTETEDVRVVHTCLDKCLQMLTPDNRELILDYYQEQKRSNIGARKKLAEQLGITSNALRVRTYRIRTVLERCVTRCIEEKDSVS